ncbi:MAG: CCA tRNA nucleotidyltransferase [Paracoccaceae bacterium]
MRIDGEWVSAPATQAVFEAIERAGRRAYFVGGCLRNALLGAPISDIDLATDALPKTVSNLAEKAGLRVIPTGIEHGTVTIISGGIAHEITTFRKDVETDGRRATVAFSSDISEDAARRDFTMNALYADRGGNVIDPLGGLDDLLARRVRFIEDPDQRIREDYLRILRFFRFHAWYGDLDAGLDAEGLAGCAANCAGLDSVSAERIGHEMLRLLQARNPGPSLGAMEQSGVLAQILPGAGIRSLLPLLHSEGDDEPQAILRLAALGGEDAAKRLRLSRPQARELAFLRDEVGRVTSLKEIAFRHGAQNASNVARLRAATFEQPYSPELETDLAHAAAQIFPLKAQDLKQVGPALGAELKRLEQIWIEADFVPDRAELLAMAKGNTDENDD